jgi:hypothetical protein
VTVVHTSRYTTPTLFFSKKALFEDLSVLDAQFSYEKVRIFYFRTSPNPASLFAHTRLTLFLHNKGTVSRNVQAQNHVAAIKDHAASGALRTAGVCD